MKFSKLIFIFIPLFCVIGLYLFIDFEKDYSKLSMVELHKLAQKEDAEAQGMLAYYFQEGINVEVDYKESLKWYLKSANNDNTSAMINLAYLYGNGIGVEKDSIKAFEWNLKAANSGDPSGMFNVGKKYEKGIGVSKDIVKANYWLEKAEKAKGYI
ncbi:tetratricopeptide repeat protein [Peribacillus sp. NPDC097675]|uniref:tetratricopeptide repeat protein n=1 Tax=Peribacillus sp. NPDC097675 TaxID=3390618 RepID=UPI003CFF239A